MAKLPASGVASISPPRGFIGLLAVAKFTAKRLRLSPCSIQFLRKIDLELSGIIGKAQATRLDAGAVRDSLSTVAAAAHLLHRVLRLQSGLSELTMVELEARGRLVEWLQRNPMARSIDTVIDRTAEDALNVAHAAEAAAVEIKLTRFPGGAPQLAWYKDFAKLSIKICKKFGLSTTLHRNKFNEPTGSVFLIAGQLERLLPESMRSRTAETRYDRLSKAMRAIRQKKGKTPSRRR